MHLTQLRKHILQTPEERYVPTSHFVHALVFVQVKQ